MSVIELQKTSRAASVQKVRSPGGIEAWLVEDYAVPLVAFEFMFRGGSAQDGPGQAGTATMMSALLDEGAGSLDSDAFHRALDDKAIEISFSADRDGLHGRLKTLSRNIDAAFGLLELAVTQARFDADAIERVRGQMMAGLRRESKDPDALAGRAWRDAAFPNHPYGQPAQGTLESVPSIDRETLAALAASVMARDNLVIAVVGAIDAARVAVLLDQVFGPLPGKAQLKPIADIVLAGLGTRHVIDLDVPQSTLRFGLPGIAFHDPDHMAAVVVNHVLGGGVFSARLFKEVREKRGLAYSVHSSLATFDHAAVFSGGTSTKNERALESLQVIEGEIAKLAAEGPSEDELDKAKKYLTGSYALRFDTSTKIAGQLVHLQAERLEVEWLDRRNALIQAVTMADALRVGKRLFDGKPLLVAAAGRPVGLTSGAST